MPVSQEALLDVIDRLYGASLEPEGWSGMADQLADLLDAVSCMVHIRNPAIDLVATNVDPSAARTYATHYAARDLWTQAITTARPGVVCLCEEFVPEETLAGSEFYNDFLRAYDDTFHCIGAWQRLDRGAAFFGLHRTRRMGAFGASQRRALGVLLPHLRRALVLRRHLAALEAGQRTREAALDALATGLIITDAHGTVVFANAAARTIVAAQDGVSLSASGRLAAARHTDTARLQSLIAQATVRPMRLDAGGAMRVARPSGRSPYAVLVTPLPPHHVPDLANGAAGLVAVTDPELEPIAPERRLMDVFGLTPAEARVVAALAGGLDPAAAADALGVSINTVRTQIRHAYMKTDTHRQSELVGLVLRLGTLCADRRRQHE